MSTRKTKSSVVVVEAESSESKESEHRMFNVLATIGEECVMTLPGFNRSAKTDKDGFRIMRGLVSEWTGVDADEIDKTGVKSATEGVEKSLTWTNPATNVTYRISRHWKGGCTSCGYVTGHHESCPNLKVRKITSVSGKIDF